MTFKQVFESAEVCEGVKPYAIPGARQTLAKLGALAERLSTPSPGQER